MKSPILERAIDFAILAHEGQVRKYTGEPYYHHPLDVAFLVSRTPHGQNIEVLIAAILHDVLEDTDMQYADIFNEFGPNVLSLVIELTKPKHEGNRKQRAAAEAVRLHGISPEAQTIKFADMIDNMKDIGLHDPMFAKVYKEEKRLALFHMYHGYQPLRQLAWRFATDWSLRK